MSVPAALLKEFISSLSGKAGTTVDAYQRELRNFLDWISQRAGNSGPFDAQQQLTKTALQFYLTYLQSEGNPRQPGAKFSMIKFRNYRRRTILNARSKPRR